MARTINFEGRKINVPDDASDDEVSKILSASSSTPDAQPAKVAPSYYPENSIGNLAQATSDYGRALIKDPTSADSNVVLGLGEGVAQIGSGLAAAGYGGLKGMYEGGKRLVAGEGLDAAAQAATEEIQKQGGEYTYQPRLTAGKYAAANLIAPFEAAKDVMAYGGGALGKTLVRPFYKDDAEGRQSVNRAGLVGESIGNIVPDVAGIAYGGRAAIKGAPTYADIGNQYNTAKTSIVDSARRSQESTAAEQSKNARKDAAAEEWRAVGGGTVPTAGVAGTVAKASDIHKLSANLRSKNNPLINELANEDLQLPKNEALSEPVIRGKMKEKYISGYEPVKTLGKIATDDTFKSDLDAITSRREETSKSFPDDKSAVAYDAKLKGVADGARGDIKDAGHMVQKIQDLRDQRTIEFRNGDTTMAKAYGDTALAIENQLDRHLKVLAESDPQYAPMLENYRNAREFTSKAHEYLKALNGSNIDAMVIRNSFKKNRGKFTGNLRLIANTAEFHPDVMRIPKIGDDAAFKPTELSTGGISAGLLHQGVSGVGTALATLTGGRILGRALLKSDFYQKNAKPTYNTPIADLIAGKREVPVVEAPQPPPVSMTHPTMQEFQAAYDAERFAADNAAGASAGIARGRNMAENAKTRSDYEAARLAAINDSNTSGGAARGENMVADATARTNYKLEEAKRMAEHEAAIIAANREAGAAGGIARGENMLNAARRQSMELEALKIAEHESNAAGGRARGENMLEMAQRHARELAAIKRAEAEQQAAAGQARGMNSLQMAMEQAKNQTPVNMYNTIR